MEADLDRVVYILGRLEEKLWNLEQAKNLLQILKQDLIVECRKKEENDLKLILTDLESNFWLLSHDYDDHESEEALYKSLMQPWKDIVNDKARRSEEEKRYCSLWDLVPQNEEEEGVDFETDKVSVSIKGLAIDLGTMVSIVIVNYFFLFVHSKTKLAARINKVKKMIECESLLEEEEQRNSIMIESFLSFIERVRKDTEGLDEILVDDDDGYDDDDDGDDDDACFDKIDDLILNMIFYMVLSLEIAFSCPFFYAMLEENSVIELEVFLRKFFSSKMVIMDELVMEKLERGEGIDNADDELSQMYKDGIEDMWRSFLKR